MQICDTIRLFSAVPCPQARLLSRTNGLSHCKRLGELSLLFSNIILSSARSTPYLSSSLHHSSDTLARRKQDMSDSDRKVRFLDGEYGRRDSSQADLNVLSRGAAIHAWSRGGQSRYVAHPPSFVQSLSVTMRYLQHPRVPDARLDQLAPPLWRRCRDPADGKHASKSPTIVLIFISLISHPIASTCQEGFPCPSSTQKK